MIVTAVISRPDVAFAVSRLARFNCNPGPEHHAAADRVIQYLQLTKNYALKVGGDEDLVVYSDASFADNSLDRKSSQAFVIRLFGGMVAWKANKQNTVTTSTTEAELLALTQAAKEGTLLLRLLKSLKITPGDTAVQPRCDNKMTIRLVTEEVKLLTKLKHVDIHNHWLRQEIQAGRASVEYTPTKEMLADGLTKALVGSSFTEFRGSIGLEDLTPVLTARKLREETLEDGDLWEERIPGGECGIGTQ